MKKHRITHILNRNISEEYKYSYEEIKIAFSKKDYSLATRKEKVAYARFFKECDEEDIVSFSKVFDIPIEDIKSIYIDIPERVFEGVSKVWDKFFKL